MADSAKPLVIDGFSSVQAVRRSGSGKAPRVRGDNEPARLPKREAAQPVKGPGASRIGSTALPKRFEIVCYDCGYTFVLQGNLNKVYCPKCRKILTVEDHDVEGEWKLDVKTVGTVTVKKTGRILNASIIARVVAVEGDITEAKICSCNELELRQGAVIDLDKIETNKITIAAGSKIPFRKTFVCRDLEVRGELKAKVRAEGLVCIKPGGMLRGELNCAHLVVEDGGGLSADLKVVPRKPEEKTEAPGRETKTTPSPAARPAPLKAAATRPAQGRTDATKASPSRTAAKGGRSTTTAKPADSGKKPGAKSAAKPTAKKKASSSKKAKPRKSGASKTTKKKSDQ